MNQIQELRDRYRSDLLTDTLPFWLKHALDRRHGGYFTALGRDGTLLDTDKSVWFQGRFAWLLARLYTDVDQRDEWLEAARSGTAFLQRHCFDEYRRMYFTVTAEGRPLRQRRYVFSEMFTIMAMAAFARAIGDRDLLAEAHRLFDHVNELVTSGQLAAKVDATTRPCKGLAWPMIRIVVGQELRTASLVLAPDNANQIDLATAAIDRCIDEIERDFLSEEFEAVLETVGPHGEFLDHYEGRTINPGHAIEAAWFILEESRVRGGDDRLDRIGLRILDCSWQWGWDEEFGGILYYRDVRGLPVQEYWHDMKFWWPQNEAIVATLLAYERTNDRKYLDLHRKAHTWAHDHFADPEYGEWFGYLHRDGRISSTAKGTLWKGPFHLPRMQLTCWQICERLLLTLEYGTESKMPVRWGNQP